MEAYLDVVRKVIKDGALKKSRSGECRSLFHVNYEIDLNHGFPLLTTKKISWKNIVMENLWFLKGDDDIKFLQKHGCKFWDPWVDEWGKIPSAYGHFWRNSELPYSWGDDNAIDQIGTVIEKLKHDPDSRRLVVSAWHPFNGLTSYLPPCHMMFVLNVDAEKRQLNMHLTQRSCDIAVGLPYNIAGYAFLMHLFSRFSGIPVGKFAHTIVDAHIYHDLSDRGISHLDGLGQQLDRDPRLLPELSIDDSIQSLEDVESLFDKSTDEIMSKFVLEGYDPHPAIKFEVAI